MVIWQRRRGPYPLRYYSLNPPSLFSCLDPDSALVDLALAWAVASPYRCVRLGSSLVRPAARQRMNLCHVSREHMATSESGLRLETPRQPHVLSLWAIGESLPRFGLGRTGKGGVYCPEPPDCCSYGQHGPLKYYIASIICAPCTWAEEDALGYKIRVLPPNCIPPPSLPGSWSEQTNGNSLAMKRRRQCSSSQKPEHVFAVE